MVRYIDHTCSQHANAAFCMHEAGGCSAAYLQNDGRYALSIWGNGSGLHSTETMGPREALDRLEDWTRSFRDEGPVLIDSAPSLS